MRALLAGWVLMAGAAGAAGVPLERGVCYAHAWHGGGLDGYGSATSRATLERLRRLGVNAVSLTPFGFMRALGSDEVEWSGRFPGGESDARLHATAAQAHALGMRVMLKPHIWIHHGDWIGAHTLPDDAAWRRWFASYRRFIVHYAELAAQDHVEALVIGTELKGASSHHRDEWQAIFAAVRAVYHGTVTYAANWDEDGVVFWDLVDEIGVQIYTPLTTHPGADEAELARGWQPIVAKLSALARRFGKPIVVTEIGYRAVRDAALAPNAWPERDRNAVFDGAHQAACYRVALATLLRLPFLRGVYIWKWFTDSKDESGPTDYSPAGKPAEAVLREFFTH